MFLEPEPDPEPAQSRAPSSLEGLLTAAEAEPSAATFEVHLSDAPEAPASDAAASLISLAARAAAILQVQLQPFQPDASVPEVLWTLGDLLDGVGRWNLVAACEKYRRQLVGRGLHTMLLAVLRHLLEMPSELAPEIAAERVLRWLAELAYTTPRQSLAVGPRLRLTRGSAELIFRALRHFSGSSSGSYGNELVTARILRLLASAAFNCDESKQSLASLCGLDPIVAAMVHYDEDETVFLAGASAITNYTFPHGLGRAACREFGYMQPKSAERCHGLCEQLFLHAEEAEQGTVEHREMALPSSRKGGAAAELSILYDSARPPRRYRRAVRHLYLTSGAKVEEVL